MILCFKGGTEQKDYAPNPNQFSATQSREDKMPKPIDYYERVPSEQKEVLLEFRASHPYRTLNFKGARIPYISSGSGDHALVFLPGAMVGPDMWFHSILAFDQDYRIFAPGWPDVPLSARDTIAAFWAGMDAEGLDTVTLIGIFAGGGTVQMLLQEQPGRVTQAVISHSGPLSPQVGAKLKKATRLMKLLPMSLLRAMSSQRAKEYPANSLWTALTQAYFKEQVAASDKASTLHFFEALIQTSETFVFDPHALDEWPGQILILSTKDDPTSIDQIDGLKTRYPQAQTHIFDEGGHHTVLLFPDTYNTILRSFFVRALESSGRDQDL
jgi:pimeloyl-ACP methyl ester carboxylesterase